jgi:hypothetical protein
VLETSWQSGRCRTWSLVSGSRPCSGHRRVYRPTGRRSSAVLGSLIGLCFGVLIGYILGALDNAGLVFAIAGLVVGAYIAAALLERGHCIVVTDREIVVLDTSGWAGRSTRPRASSTQLLFRREVGLDLAEVRARRHQILARYEIPQRNRRRRCRADLHADGSRCRPGTGATEMRTGARLVPRSGRGLGQAVLGRPSMGAFSTTGAAVLGSATRQLCARPGLTGV